MPRLSALLVSQHAAPVLIVIVGAYEMEDHSKAMATTNTHSHTCTHGISLSTTSFCGMERRRSVRPFRQSRLGSSVERLPSTAARSTSPAL